MRPFHLKNRLLNLFAMILLLVLATLGVAQTNQPQATPTATPQTSPTARPAQTPGEGEAPGPRDPMSTPTFNGLRFRSLGPAFTSGRVIGFAVDPNNASKYFVASASGGGASGWPDLANGLARAASSTTMLALSLSAASGRR